MGFAEAISMPDFSVLRISTIYRWLPMPEFLREHSEVRPVLTSFCVAGQPVPAMPKQQIPGGSAQEASKRSLAVFATGVRPQMA
jgi:hypothetical protein